MLVPTDVVAWVPGEEFCGSPSVWFSNVSGSQNINHPGSLLQMQVLGPEPQHCDGAGVGWVREQGSLTGFLGDSDALALQSPPLEVLLQGKVRDAWSTFCLPECSQRFWSGLSLVLYTLKATCAPALHPAPALPPLYFYSGFT